MALGRAPGCCSRVPVPTVYGGASAQVGRGVAGDPGDDGGGGDADDDGRLEVARHQDGHDRQAAKAHPHRAAVSASTLGVGTVLPCVWTFDVSRLPITSGGLTRWVTLPAPP